MPISALTMAFCFLAGTTSSFRSADEVRALIAHFVQEPADVERLLQHLHGEAIKLENDLNLYGNSTGMADQLERQVALNLKEKKALDEKGPRLPLTATEISRTVIGFEIFKMKTFVSSGVFPKRYFGYFDQKYDTAIQEARLRETVEKVVSVINLHQQKQKRNIRITSIEVAITFLAEGGALFLREHQDVLNRLHPVFHVGLDDVAMGFQQHASLIEAIDRAVGTRLGNLVGWVKGHAIHFIVDSRVSEKERWLKHGNGEEGPFAYLKRYMTFEEAIVGTALMYLWEKELAEKKMTQKNHQPLHLRSLQEQFIIGSLVYNSGRLHEPARWEAIRTFSTGEWLYKTSEANAKKRWKLQVLPPAACLEHLREEGAYLEQPTEWLAAYHVLQRFGAFRAIQQYTDVFAEDGSFTRQSPHKH